MKTNELTCSVCGQEGARTKRLSRAYGKGEDVVVIDNVPIIVCSSCGESYMTADTMHEIARIRLHKRSIKAQRLAPVLRYV